MSFLNYLYFKKRTPELSGYQSSFLQWQCLSSEADWLQSMKSSFLLDCYCCLIAGIRLFLILALGSNRYIIDSGFRYLVDHTDFSKRCLLLRGFFEYFGISYYSFIEFMWFHCFFSYFEWLIISTLEKM